VAGKLHFAAAVEKREITATYRASQLGAAKPYLEVKGWNTELLSYCCEVDRGADADVSTSLIRTGLRPPALEI